MVKLNLISYFYEIEQFHSQVGFQNLTSKESSPAPNTKNMKRILLGIITSLIIGGVSAQGRQCRIDSIYYNRSGKIAASPVFAEYLRIALYPADSTARKEYKDFYLSGKLRSEGYFLHIDSLDDSRTLFDGENNSYYKSGKIFEKKHYTNGQLNGSYQQYDESGKLKIEACYLAGKLSGPHKTYNEDGSCQIVEYNDGIPLHDYYLLTDPQGNTLKFRMADDMPVWETPSIAERFIDYRDGTPWEVYYKNGLTIALTSSVIRDYGKWHRIDLILSNNSTTPIEFTPETDIIAYSADEDNNTNDLPIWPCDAYLKKVNRSQTWAAVLMGVSEGMATAGAGYATSTTYGYSSNGGYSSYTTTTYNPTVAYQTNLASQQRIANFSQALQDEQDIKKMGYLKRSTIYPGESISGFVHAEWVKGNRVVFVINIGGAEYLFEWGFDRKNTYLLNQ
ncbi:membrane-binding protein [uncultured Alistipes sp.]|uniref:toxin-antitoxin system YwqK family antitoxin n=1 Tax=uncultured Alistipes sp. TaxID=538949 RepID=UPI003209455B